MSPRSTDVRGAPTTGWRIVTVETWKRQGSGPGSLSSSADWSRLGRPPSTGGRPTPFAPRSLPDDGNASTGACTSRRPEVRLTSRRCGQACSTPGPAPSRRVRRRSGSTTGSSRRQPLCTSLSRGAATLEPSRAFASTGRAWPPRTSRRRPVPRGSGWSTPSCTPLEQPRTKTQRSRSSPQRFSGGSRPGHDSPQLWTDTRASGAARSCATCCRCARPAHTASSKSGTSRFAAGTAYPTQSGRLTTTERSWTWTTTGWSSNSTGGSAISRARTGGRTCCETICTQPPVAPFSASPDFSCSPNPRWSPMSKRPLFVGGDGKEFCGAHAVALASRNSTL